MINSIQHLPKTIDTSYGRFHFYENHWKTVGMDLLARQAGTMDGLSLLDYGCGRGETLKIAKSHGIKALGTDLDVECVALSKEYGDAIHLEEPHDPVLQFGENSFDIVTCFHVLEHVERPKEILTALGRIARRYVLVAVPNLRTLPKPRFFLREPKSVNEGHLQGWDHVHFRNLAERHCHMKLLAWGHDYVRMPVLSNLAAKTVGNRLTIHLETGLFLSCFKYHSASIIALLVPGNEPR